jgi:hypothetical protein
VFHNGNSQCFEPMYSGLLYLCDKRKVVSAVGCASSFFACFYLSDALSEVQVTEPGLLTF